MRGTGDCCHYDEGYDDGLEDGRSESNDGDYLEGMRNGLLAARNLQEHGKSIDPMLDRHEVERLAEIESDKENRMVLHYKEALTR